MISNAPAPLDVRLMRRVERDEASGCWSWIGAVLPNGYGYIGLGGGRNGYPHRVSYEYHVGPIPDDCDIHHKCANRLCVNPDHLHACTRREHMRRDGRLSELRERNRRGRKCP